MDAFGASPEQRSDAFDLRQLIYHAGGNQERPCANSFPAVEADHEALPILFCRAYRAVRAFDRFIGFELPS